MALTLPKVYRAQARLLVESPQIPDDLAASTVRAGSSELLQIIQQRLLTRANLLDIARRFNVYDDTPKMSANDIVDDVRRRIRFDIPHDRNGTGLVLISFEASSAVVSAEVTNELLTQVLQQNVELRTEVTGQTLDFFEQEVSRLNAELGQQGARILEFKLANKDTLPESLEYRRTRVLTLQERILQINREFASLTERRARLQELFEQTGRIDLSEASMSPAQRQLRQLQNELASARVIYSPENPRIKSLQTRVEALEQSAKSPVGPGGGSELLTAYDLQISDIDAQITFLADQKALVESELETLIASIEATPENAITLGTLERDYENLRTQFNQATEGLGEARTGDRIEALSKGQRIVVIEQASVPGSPSAPNRKLIAAGAVAGGAAAGLGLIFLLELLNQSIRRPIELTNALGIQPYATLPYTTTPGQILRRRLIITVILLCIVVGLPLMLYLLHTMVVPIDVLIEKLRNAKGS
ncbi:lipopolysaccharide biosynthesis protein [Roseovarius sp. M141]|uniref:GumC family protein n=1 Tax=Roseovarius sp. M141 TaxID=2583806 RepID=UPI0020CF74E1|nr:lipopolysaccharide biosynthesis protein [Roseovarius sp. M141]